MCPVSQSYQGLCLPAHSARSCVLLGCPGSLHPRRYRLIDRQTCCEPEGLPGDYL